MRKLIIGLLAVFALFTFVRAARAQTPQASDILKGVQMRIYKGGSQVGGTLTMGTDVIYVTKTTHPRSGTITTPYIKVGNSYEQITYDSNTQYEPLVVFKDGFPNYIPNNANLDQIHIEFNPFGGCGSGTQKRWFFPNQTLTLEKSGACKLDIFGQGDEVGVKVTIKYKDGTPNRVYDFANFKFTIQDMPVSACDIKVTDAAGTELTHADNNTNIRVVVENANSRTNYSVFYFDGARKNISGGASWTTQPNFLVDIGYLDVGSHRVEVREYDLGTTKDGAVMCSIIIPVTEPGATPTPITEVTQPATTSTTVELPATVPLCDTVPDQFQDECLKCQEGMGADLPRGVWTGIGCVPIDLPGIIKALFTTLSGLLGGLIFLCIVTNGLKIMTARGNAEVLKKSQEAITSCIVGFLVLVFSVLFLRVVGVDILQIPGWS